VEERQRTSSRSSLVTLGLDWLAYGMTSSSIFVQPWAHMLPTKIHTTKIGINKIKTAPTDRKHPRRQSNLRSVDSHVSRTPQTGSRDQVIPLHRCSASIILLT